MLFAKNDSADSGRPVFAAWFGNFFEPYYSDFSASDAGIAELKKLGMNSLILDSKLWSDFTEYFKTGKTSKYLKSQLHIVEQCKKNSLGVSFLALYYIGDNLYPDVYEYPPEYVDQPVDIEGKPIRGYRHWSKAQQAEQVRHCLDLYKHIAGEAAAAAEDERGNEKLPFYFYHDPVFTPIFDEDGIRHYLNWLKKQYSLEQLNRRYKTDFDSFENLTPADYWVHPEKGASRWDVPTEDDYKNRPEVILKYADNQKYKLEVMERMFAELCARLREQQPRFYLYSSISQWKYFFNDCEHAWYWDASRRNVDIWDAGKQLDSPSFTAVPCDCYSEPDAYSVSCELAMLRSASGFTDFIAGLFLGRYLYNDIYHYLTPAEVIASAFGAGATDLYFYGYNGLDDGGNFGKWPEHKKRSIKQGLDFFTELRRKAGKILRPKTAATAFPFATFHLQHAGCNWREYAANRQDTLGWYRQFADSGINPDILHPCQIKDGMPDGYKILVLPADPLYWAMPDKKYEQAVMKFAENGGTVMASAGSGLFELFGVETAEHEADAIKYRHEKFITESSPFVYFKQGDTLADYMSDYASAVIEKKVGKGKLICFGFNFGNSYIVKRHLPAPPRYGIDNIYPLSVIDSTPVEDILDDMKLRRNSRRGVEIIPFQKGTLTINHTAYNYTLPSERSYICSSPGFDGKNLPPHTAVFG